MKRKYNDYEDILAKKYKKEQNEKLIIRIKNAKSIVNTNVTGTNRIFKKKKNNKSHGPKNISKKIFFIIYNL